MTKFDLQDLLDSLKIAVNEGIQNDINTNIYPRVVYWDYLWSTNTASGTNYSDIVTYQISFFSDIPRHPKLLELKKKLNEMKIFPEIEHEYIEKDRYWHSFFAIEVLENV